MSAYKAIPCQIYTLVGQTYTRILIPNQDEGRQLTHSHIVSRTLVFRNPENKDAIQIALVPQDGASNGGLISLLENNAISVTKVDSVHLPYKDYMRRHEALSKDRLDTFIATARANNLHALKDALDRYSGTLYDVLYLVGIQQNDLEAITKCQILTPETLGCIERSVSVLCERPVLSIKQASHVLQGGLVA